jgi:hypothetical protein
MLWTLVVGLGTELVLQAGWWEFLQPSNWYGNHFQKLFCMLHVMLAFLLFLFTNVFMDMIAMKPCTIFWSTTELSCIFAAVIWETESWDSLVTDMKFWWLNLYGPRMSNCFMYSQGDYKETHWMVLGPSKHGFFVVQDWKMVKPF